MAYLFHESEAADATVKTVAALNPPANATHVEIQAVTQPVSYRMDGGNAAALVGMLFLTTEPPKQFLIEDLRNISFTQTAAGAGLLQFHYFAGRNV
jgi:hypothetical protein